ncbi:MAG: segregation/condensation protein A [Chitinophagales bacterium]|nr:segregation/condensation protein A [Chitinophagales bacterium]MDW8394151.1 segregation/condensation protein A [Chitinophagales bacterium]
MAKETAVGYEIKLPHFEGPFDLLLFFIQRDELDIYDIPIAKVTHDFLEYIRQASEKNIELASEFIVVAATLMRIKAKMLLPRRQEPEAGEAADPRAELVRQLLEYKRYKDVLEELRQLEAERARLHARGYAAQEKRQRLQEWADEMELHSLTLIRLLRAYERVMSRFAEQERRQPHAVIRYPYTIEAQKEYLLQLTGEEETVSFEKIFDSCIDRMHAIFTFLALLELVLQQQIGLSAGETCNNFFIYRRHPEAVSAEGISG